MDHLPRLVAEVSRNVDYGQLEKKQAPAETAAISEEVSSKDADVSTDDVKTTVKDDIAPETSKKDNDVPEIKVIPTQPRPSIRHRRRTKVRFSVGDIVEVVRHHREDPERNAATATRTLRVRHDQWFNARIIKIYPDVSRVMLVSVSIDPDERIRELRTLYELRLRVGTLMHTVINSKQFARLTF